MPAKPVVKLLLLLAVIIVIAPLSDTPARPGGQVLQAIERPGAAIGTPGRSHARRIGRHISISASASASASGLA